MNSAYLRVTRPSRLPTCSCVPSTSLRPFSTTSPTLESKQKRKSRLVRKTHLAKKAALSLAHEAGKPDPIRGYSSGNEAVWDTSLLKKILLDREDVWGKTVRGEDGDVLPAQVKVDNAGGAGYTPTYFNFGLDPSSTIQLSNELPLVSALKDVGSLSPESLTRDSTADAILAATTEEMEKRERLMRIVDLRNANSKGIQVENVRRIVKAFGEGENDTGRPEVQAAILTSRIHSLTSHLTSQPRDIHNKRSLRTLIHKRATVLKYLRSLDVSRYETCLSQIGVQSRAVEGEIVVAKKVLREVVKGV